MKATDWFYKTEQWKNCRDAYAKSVGGLCEKCLQNGRYEPGEIVHHKVPLTPQNVSDPEISLNWDNLQLLCRMCHGDAHRTRVRRWTVDALGRIEIR